MFGESVSSRDTRHVSDAHVALSPLACNLRMLLMHVPRGTAAQRTGTPATGHVK